MITVPEFDAIYFVLDGDLVLQLYDPTSGETTEQKLSANELVVILRGVHHKVIEASAKNRLCVIIVPEFDRNDEHETEL